MANAHQSAPGSRSRPGPKTQSQKLGLIFAPNVLRIHLAGLSAFRTFGQHDSKVPECRSYVTKLNLSAEGARMASGLTPRTVRTCESRMAAYRIWACPSRRIRNLRRGFCRSSRTCSVLVHSAPQQRRGPSLQFGENILLTLAISSLVRKLPVVWTEACAVNVNLVENNSKLEFQNQVVSEPEERAPRHARSVIHTRRSMTSSTPDSLTADSAEAVMR
jgi:hypothetical protein